MSSPTQLPFGYVVPLFDTVKALSGIDMDTYAIPILVVDDLHNYGDPTPNPNAPGTLQQPGYRKLMQYGQAVRQALRAGGAGITVGGIAATSIIPAVSYAWVKVDETPYRGVRIALQAQQRRARA